MSSSLSEFLNAWNETMPLQIRESDIKNPTENVLRRLLISMLKQFYVDTTFFENMDNENGSRLKASRVKLVATVNLFYKIAFPGAKQDFFFMDLIQPSKFFLFCFKIQNVPQCKNPLTHFRLQEILQCPQLLAQLLRLHSSHV